MGVQTISYRQPITFDPQSPQSNETVAEVQRGLNEINQTSALPEDGVFDQATEDAVRDFQRSSRLPDTGVIDKPTIAEMNRQLQSMSTEETGAAEGPGAPTLSEAARNRRIQELRTQEPVIRQDLESQTPIRSGPGGNVITDNVEPPEPGLRGLEPQYEVTAREAGPARFDTAAQAVSDPTPHNLHVNGHDFRVCGATDAEARVIENTLKQLPASHLDRLPPTIAVARQLSNNRISGGAQFPDDPTPRLELSHESLATAAAQQEAGENPVSSTLLHEAGHLVGSGTYGNHRRTYDGAPYDRLQNLPVTVPSDAQDPATRDRIERYAQAYMMYFGGSARNFRGLSPEQRQAMQEHFKRSGIPDA